LKERTKEFLFFLPSLAEYTFYGKGRQTQ